MIVIEYFSYIETLFCQFYSTTLSLPEFIDSSDENIDGRRASNKQ